MRYVVTAEEMKRADAYTMDTIGLPSMVLMERAALAAHRVLHGGSFCLDKVLVVCGTGNNGADGMALARLLYLEGTAVTVRVIGDIRRGSGQAVAQYHMLQFYQVPELEMDAYTGVEIPDAYTTVVDAIYGVGLSRDVTGEHAAWVEAINQAKGRVLALDICSGIHSDTGAVMGTAVQADETVTFAFEKAGQLLYPGAFYAGKITVADIGITKESFAGVLPKQMVSDNRDFAGLAPRRMRTNKGSYGKVLVIAGSRGMAGAAYLSAAGAYRMGCGLVRILTCEANREILQTLLPEAMTVTWETKEASTREQLAGENGEAFLREQLAWADAVIFGPGIGTGPAMAERLRIVLRLCDKPLVLDADGLNLLAEHADVWEERRRTGAMPGDGQPNGAHQAQTAQTVCAPVILTPHPGEMARLLERTVPEVTVDIAGCAAEAAERFGAVTVLKDAHTVTAAPDGRWCINTAGSNGMATGGSGDVLSGVLGGLLAQQAEPFAAAAAGVRLHALAGERAAERKGTAAMLAGDLIQQLRGPEEELAAGEE